MKNGMCRADKIFYVTLAVAWVGIILGSHYLMR
jgi:hypothetical protein